MKPGDIVFWRDEKFGHHRFWEIDGVYLGALDQESVVGVKSMNRSGAYVSGVGKIDVMYIPEALLREVTIYTPTARNIDTLIRAGNRLCFMAETSGGTAGRDEGLCAAISEWVSARDISDATRPPKECTADAASDLLAAWKEARDALNGAPSTIGLGRS